MRRTYDFNKMQTGLWDRVTGMFAPKDGKRAVDVDKLALIEILLNGILLLAAVRVIDAVLHVNAGMSPAFRWIVAIATLILTEGGFIIWRAFRYKKTANKTQRDIAAGAMITSFLASLAIGVSDYIGLAIGDGALNIGAASITGQQLMVFVVGIAYAVAIIGHVLCAILVKEFDDQVSADAANNFIEQEAENARRATALTERRAEVAADGLIRQAGLVSGVLANLSIAPTAATIAAVSRVRRQVAEQYGDFVSVDDVDALLGQVLTDLPSLTRHAYAGSVKEFAMDPDTIADLGLHPDRLAEAIERATSNMEGMLRGSLGKQGGGSLGVEHGQIRLAGAPPILSQPPSATPVPLRIPQQPPRYTLNSLLTMIGKGPEEARDALENFGLTTAPTAFNALKDYGTLPPEMTLAEFALLYEELMAPVYGPAPAPLQPIPEPVYKNNGSNVNGNGGQPNFR
jgi:hypothetical protein